MNSKKAKKLRRRIKEQSKSIAKHYGRMKNGQIVNIGDRAMYLRAKKEAK